jgi:hypothetical protein
MRKFILPALLFLCSCLQAQEKKFPVDYKAAIHFNPFALAEIDYTFLAGTEYRLRPNVAMVLEAGYVFASDYIYNANYDPRATGFLIRPSLRWYHGKRNKFYLQPQLFYKQVTNVKYDWLGKDCVDGVPAYNALQDFRYKRYIAGINAIAGRLLPLGRKEKLLLDLYFGLGVRYKQSAIPGECHSCYAGAGVIDSSEDPDNGFFPSVPFGLKLIFVIY